MTIQRISNESFEKIITGQLQQDTSCVIKFYSNKCPMCHALKEDYHIIADSFKDIYFFAFNVDEHPAIEQLVSISGVPSIAFVKGPPQFSVKLLDDPSPDKAHVDTWYHASDIIKFIEENIK